MRLALGLSQSVAYKHIARLAEQGLVARVVVGDGDGGVVRITRSGAREAREHGATDVVSPRSAAPSSARHDRAVSWVASLAEIRDLKWLGPAELRSQAGWRVQREDGAKHYPDLAFVYGNHRVAIEVELHAKAPRRVRAILRGYRVLADYDALAAVSYVTDRDDVVALIRREGRATLLGSKLEVGPLEKIVKVARAEGGKSDDPGGRIA